MGEGLAGGSSEGLGSPGPPMQNPAQLPVVSDESPSPSGRGTWSTTCAREADWSSRLSNSSSLPCEFCSRM